jgi:hypothetical protein
MSGRSRPGRGLPGISDHLYRALLRLYLHSLPPVEGPAK